MNFQDFIEFVPQIITANLPAIEAHALMAPVERIETLKKGIVHNGNHREAAVMMLLYPKMGKTHLVLILRNSYEGVHSGQIAFPGGKYETEDLSFSVTALRETQEEIGVIPEKMEIVKPFTPMYIPPSNFMVYPFLGIAREELIFVPDPGEVAQIIELPLTLFLSDEILIQAQLKTSYAESVQVPAFKIDGHIVWGATAMMLSELKEVLKIVFKS